MRVNIALEVPDDVRRRIRAGLKRGGRATRADIRVWAGHIIDRAIRELPEAKVRRPKPAPAKVEPPPAEDARCGRCGKSYEEHGKMSGSCPPVSGVPRGGRFTREEAA